MAEGSETPVVNDEADGAWDVPNVLDETVEMFSNGFGTNLIKERFTRVIETAAKKKAFLGSGEWDVSINFYTLPFLWMQSKVQPHYMGDLIRINDIICKELGYDSLLAYIETRGLGHQKDPQDESIYA